MCCVYCTKWLEDSKVEQALQYNVLQFKRDVATGAAVFVKLVAPHYGVLLLTTLLLKRWIIIIFFLRLKLLLSISFLYIAAKPVT